MAERKPETPLQDEINRFLDRVSDVESRAPTELIDFFVYFLTVEREESEVTPAAVERCFDFVNLHRPVARAYLARNSEKGRGKHPKFVRGKYGYRLERSRRTELEQELSPEGVGRVETSQQLRGLLAKVIAPTERSFLAEAILCYEVGAHRAAIVMGWLLTLDHLFEYVLRHKLAEFNAALAKNTDRRVKIAVVQVKEDFGEMPESKFIEFCRSAGIISNDVRKVLDTKLGIRNSAAHPSSIVVTQVRATEFLDDLVENVIIPFVL